MVLNLQTGLPTNAPLPAPRYGVRQRDEFQDVPTNAPLPVPRYRIFSRAATVNIWDGETVLLGGPMQDSGSQPQSTNTQSETLMVFITATIIDPAGKRVHTDKDMPFAKVAPPPQEATPPQPQGTNAPK